MEEPGSQSSSRVTRLTKQKMKESEKTQQKETKERRYKTRLFTRKNKTIGPNDMVVYRHCNKIKLEQEGPTLELKVNAEGNTKGVTEMKNPVKGEVSDDENEMDYVVTVKTEMDIPREPLVGETSEGRLFVDNQKPSTSAAALQKDRSTSKTGIGRKQKKMKFEQNLVDIKNPVVKVQHGPNAMASEEAPEMLSTIQPMELVEKEIPESRRNRQPHLKVTPRQNKTTKQKAQKGHRGYGRGVVALNSDVCGPRKERFKKWLMSEGTLVSIKFRN